MRARSPAPLIQHRIGESLALLKTAQQLGCEKLAVMVSSGKDSVVLMDLVERSGICAVYVNHYLVPELDIDEEVLQALERRYHVKIHRVASPRRADMRASDTLCIQHVWDAKVSKTGARSQKFDRMVAALAGTGWMATGIRITDGPQRAIALTRNPNPNPKTQRLYPIASWRKADVWGHMHAERLPISRAYALMGRSLDCLNVTHVYPLKHGSPRDYARILNDFPLLEPLCWLYEKRAARIGMAALPEC